MISYKVFANVPFTNYKNESIWLIDWYPQALVHMDPSNNWRALWQNEKL